MAETQGINHLGLSVSDLAASRDFFVSILGWEESGYDPSYPRTAVSDGKLRLTLWQVDASLNGEPFNRRKKRGASSLGHSSKPVKKSCKRFMKRSQR